MVNLRAEHDNGAPLGEAEPTGFLRAAPPFRLLRMLERSAGGGCRGRTEGIVVARTDEDRERRASLRARRTAEAAEADDRRVEERRLQWQREGVYMTRAEIEAGGPCRGCGQPLLDGLGDWDSLNNLTRISGQSMTGLRNCTANGTGTAGRTAGAWAVTGPCTAGTAARCRPCQSSKLSGSRGSCPLPARGRRT
jgi:hypothetical protein